MLFNFTLEGNIAATPELRWLENGTPVCELRLMRTARFQRNGQWVDGRTVGISLTCWRQLAEHVAELNKGDTVIAEVGDDLHGESFQGRAFLRATARSVGVSMRFAGATSQRQPRTATPGDTDGQPPAAEVPVSGGYDTHAGSGYAGPGTEADTGQDAGPDEPVTEVKTGGRGRARRTAAA